LQNPNILRDAEAAFLNPPLLHGNSNNNRCHGDKAMKCDVKIIDLTSHHSGSGFTLTFPALEEDVEEVVVFDDVIEVPAVEPSPPLLHS